MTADQPREDAIAAGPDAREAFIRRIVALTPGNFTDDFLFLLDRLDEARAAMTTPREDAIAALRAAVMLRAALAAEADRGTGDPLRKAAQEFLWEAQAYRTAHYNGTHMTADGTAAWAVREREFEKKAKALRAVLDARITEVTK